MKIIQSFAQFDDGNIWVNGQLNGSEIYLNFYTFFLSYLTLKKYYNSVTMYCNKKAYETFIKYIPYDEVIIKENIYSIQYWNSYKLSVIADVNENFIHVDSDVFIFDDLFRPFIDNPDKYDIMVQHIIPKNLHGNNCFTNMNRKFLNDNNILKYDINYDGRCCTNGCMGMNLNIRDKYIIDSNKIYEAFRDRKIINCDDESLDYYNFHSHMIIEEHCLYLTALNNNFKIYDILPYDEIETVGEKASGNNRKYTHMWNSTKYVLDNILLIKNKIKKDFPNSYNLVEKYDKDIHGKNILIYKNIGNNLLDIIKYEV